MILDIRGLRVRLGSSEILKDVTFRIGEGEMVALLGPNGSGKSTLLRTIFGILSPETGVIYLDGKKISEMPVNEIAREMGYLPQETSEPDLKVIDVVLLGRTPYMEGLKLPDDSDIELARNALKKVGLEGFENRAFTSLSGGEKQKVFLARVFAQDARILLLDEPTSHLDISSQIDIMEIIRESVEDGRSALIAIHDINLSASFCNRIMMIKNGKVIYAGTPEDVITSENIRDVFRAEVDVKKHGGRIFLVPKIARSADKGKRVHVICGGGSGRDLIYLLDEMGYTVSAGVLNTLDSDWEAINEIGGEVVSEAPFSPISRESHEENLRFIDKSDLVVLSSIPVGKGNFPNLRAALESALQGKLVVIESNPFSERNFYGEKAEKIYSQIIKLCEKRIVKDIKGLRVILNEILG